MPGPKLLIEQWFPIEVIGAECMRERGASSALTPLYFLHIWWARRPLTVSRAAILASLLPAYPEEGEGADPWPDRFRSLFPSFEAYKGWFLRLVGILGDPVAGRKLIAWAKLENKKLKFNPYGYPRAFTVSPKEEQLEQLYDLLEWTWGCREITFCDPMSGGGSIPFEALRYGLSVHANELNPVASVILKATLDYPSRFGPSVAADIVKYGKLWGDRVRQRLATYFPQSEPDENIFVYLWARTVACPETGKPVPLSPNWWLSKGTVPTAVRVLAEPDADRCHFEIVRGSAACKQVDPDKGTVKRGTGVSPWTGDPIPGDYIKTQAQSGGLGEQLYAIGVKKVGGTTFRAPTDIDVAASDQAEQELQRRWATFESAGLIPLEPRQEGRADWACRIYGASRWCDTYSPRQLLSLITFVEMLSEVVEQSTDKLPPDCFAALRAYSTLIVDKCADYNSKPARWDGTRDKVVNSFARHDLSMRWSFSEFDASRNLLPWAVSQVADATRGITALAPTSTVTV